MIDIYLLDNRLPRADAALLEYCVATFETRGKQPWPPNITLRDGWNAEVRELIARSGLPISVDDIVAGVNSLLARLLGIDMPE